MQSVTALQVNPAIGLKINKPNHEQAAELIHYHQNQELIETAQKAFSQDESENQVTFVSGDIAKEALNKNTKQTLIFEVIQQLHEYQSGLPRIQEKI